MKFTKPSRQKVRRVVIALGLTAIILFIFKEIYDHYRPPDASLNPDPNHTHADFAVWIGDEMVDLTDNEYMSGLSTSDESHDEEHEYLHKYLHLHDNVGHVVHMHKPGLTMGEFFQSLGFRMTQECFTMNDGRKLCDGERGGWRVFLNAEEVDGLNPGYVFSDLDKILYSYSPTQEQLEEQWDAMTDDACLYSQACPWRGPAPEENCIADPAIPCIGSNLDLDAEYE